MKRGILKWFNVRHAYGFIIDDEGRDVFFHKNHMGNQATIDRLYKEPQSPVELHYRIDETKTGPRRARWVSLTEGVRS